MELDSDDVCSCVIWDFVRCSRPCVELSVQASSTNGKALAREMLLKRFL